MGAIWSYLPKLSRSGDKAANSNATGDECSNAASSARGSSSGAVVCSQGAAAPPSPNYLHSSASMNTTAIRLDSPAPAAPAPRDSWEFISGTVVQRFLDYYWVRHGVSNETLKAYRTELVALDRWMLLFRQRTLVTAREQDIRDFLHVKYSLSN